MRLYFTTALTTVSLLLVTNAMGTTELPAPRWLAEQPDEGSSKAEPRAPNMPAPQMVAPIAPAPDMLTAPVLEAAPPAPLLAITPAPDAFAIAPALSAPTAANPFQSRQEPEISIAPVVMPPFDIAPAAQPSNQAVTQRAPETQVDDRALRYYAAQRDMVRVGAEIRRLKAKHPKWQPPSDMFAPEVGIDEQPLWNLFKDGNFAEMRRQISALQKAQPGWQPSSEMTSKMTLAESRQRIAEAAKFGRWADVVNTAARAPGMLVCANMDLVWWTAEGLARTNQLAKSYDLYGYAVTNCADEQERYATVQKASMVLPADGKNGLIAMATRYSTEPSAYESLRFDTQRGRLGDFAAGKTEVQLTQAELQSFATFVNADHSPNDVGLIGWYLYALGDFESAAGWFKAGMQLADDNKLTEGYLLALRQLGRDGEAESIAYRYRGRSPDISKIYVEIVAAALTYDPKKEQEHDNYRYADEEEAAYEPSLKITRSMVNRFEEAVGKLKSPLGAQALGWHELQKGDIKEADEWFQKSIKWGPSEGGVIGAAVIAARLKQNTRLRTIKATFQEEFPDLEKFRVGSDQRRKVYRSRSRRRG